MKPHAFHPAAAQEYADAASCYTHTDAELAGRFYDEMERLIREVRCQPGRFRPFAPPARWHFSSVFPHAVIYVDKPDRVWIVAIMHLKRRPGYWKSRL